MDARLLKEKALQFFQKGKFAKAGEVWAQVCQADPKDNQSRLRLGDALAKAGQVENAFEAYRAAAEGFAKAGFLPQATAAAKLALGIKPHALDVQALVAGFHAERFGRPPTPASGVASDMPPPAFESSPSRGRVSAPLAKPPGPPVFGSSPSSLRSLPPPPPWPVASEPGEGVAGDMAEFEPYIDQALGLAQAGAPPMDEMVPPPPPADVTGASIPRPVRRPPFRLMRPPAIDPVEPLLEAELVAEAVVAPALVPPPPPAPSAPFLPAVDEEEVMPSAPVMEEIHLGGRSNPEATMLGNVAVMEQLRLRSSEQDSTVVAMNPLASAPPPPTNPGHHRLDEAVAEVSEEGGRREFPRVPLFEAMSSDAFLALLKECPLRDYSIHEVVLEQGRPGDSFFVILAGRVRVFREEGSSRRELAILEDGAFFGEMALLTGAPRSAWVVAEVDDTKLLEIPAPTVRRLSMQYPSVAEGMASFARRRILSNVMASEPLFAGLKRNERQALADRFEAREAESGEVLMSRGAAPAGLVVPVSGQLLRAGRDGTPRHYGPGTLVGDLDTLEGVVMETVEVQRRGLILSLGPDEVGRLLTHPSLAGKQSALIEAARRRLGV
jgi:CRP-like cAMP-binding protein